MIENKISYLNTSQTAKLLNISKTSLYRYINDKVIPYYKPKGVILFKLEEVTRWVESHRVSTIDETKTHTVNEFNAMINSWKKGF